MFTVCCRATARWPGRSLSLQHDVIASTAQQEPMCAKKWEKKWLFGEWEEADHSIYMYAVHIDVPNSPILHAL